MVERTHMKYIVFTKIEKDPKSKIVTDQWYITATNREYDIIGYIIYYNAWRKYIFKPEHDTFWDNQCLGEVIRFLDKENEERRERLKKEKNEE